MALAEVFHGDEVDVGEWRWADWWVLPSHDVVLGGALLDVFEGWDGDDSMVSLGVHERFVALDRRLMAYEDWCDRQRIVPARRSLPDATAPVRLRLVEGDGQAVTGGPVLCGDCSGSGVVADVDGLLSGRVGMLVECVCAEPALPVPVVVEACQTALGRPLTGDERSVMLVAEYVTRCQVLDIEPDWCLSCGAHRGPADRRTPCGCRGAT